MTYLIQGDEFEIGSDLRERLAKAIVACTELTLTDARYRLRSALGILRFDAREDAERVSARFTDLGFANFLLDELLPVPPPRLLGVGTQIPDEPIELVVLALLETETVRAVTDAQYPPALQVGCALLGGGVVAPQGKEVRIARRETNYLLDLFTRDAHWRVRAGALARIVDVFTAINVTGARLSAGVHSLSDQTHRVPVFADEKDHGRYLTWLVQLRFA